MHTKNLACTFSISTISFFPDHNVYFLTRFMYVELIYSFLSQSMLEINNITIVESFDLQLVKFSF